MRVPYFSLVAAGALTLGGCAYGDVGFGVGGGYGAGYYGGGYYDAYAPYGAPYYGWYDDFYYPGTGIYVYDSYRRPHAWNDRQRTYWTSRQQAMRTSNRNTTIQDNWSGFHHRPDTRRPR